MSSLSAQSAWLVLVRISAGPIPRCAQFCRIVLEIIMKIAAGMPLPLTSAMTTPSRSSSMRKKS